MATVVKLDPVDAHLDELRQEDLDILLTVRRVKKNGDWGISLRWSRGIERIPYFEILGLLELAKVDVLDQYHEANGKQQEEGEEQ